MKFKKIEWKGNILDSEEETPVALKGSKPKNKTIPTEAKTITGTYCLKIEKKGRAGKPVIILSNFSDSEANNVISLKKLCSDLKTKLACGGTIEDEKIILIMQDTERLKQLLNNQFDLHISKK